MDQYHIKDDADFEVVKNTTELFYKSVGDIWCPYFNERIAFNTKGWQHLCFKKRLHARHINDQYVRFKLFPLAPEILRKSHTVQGILKTKIFEEITTNSRHERVLKEVVYWEFVAVFEGVRVCIIVKEVEQQKYFWSIIPFWKEDAAVHKRLLHSNIPELD